MFVKNLNFDSSEEDFKNFLFEKKIKGVKNIKIVRINGKSQGYGFVEFDTSEEALEMMKEIQNCLFDKHILKLEISRKTETQKKTGKEIN